MTATDGIHSNVFPRVSDLSCGDFECDRTSVDIYESLLEGESVALSSVVSEGFLAGSIHAESGRYGDALMGVCELELSSPVTASLFSSSVSHDHSHDISDVVPENDRDNGVCNAISQSTQSSVDGNEENLPFSDLRSRKEGKQGKMISCKVQTSGKQRPRPLNGFDVRQIQQSKSLATEQKNLDFKRWTFPRRAHADSLRSSSQGNNIKENSVLQDKSWKSKQNNDHEPESDSDCTGETLRSFRDRLFLKKQAESLKRKTAEKETGLKKATDNHKKCKYMLRALRETPKWLQGESHSKEIKRPRATCDLACIDTRRQLGEESHAKEMKNSRSNCHFTYFATPRQLHADSHTNEVRTPKELVRDIAKEALLEAGFKIELRPRQSRNYNDSVYVSPEGNIYWSLPKAWDALKSDKSSKNMVDDEEEILDEGRIHSVVDKSTLEQVLVGFGEDERLLSALKKMCHLSCTGIHDIVSQVEVTNAKLADILLVDLGILRRITNKAKERKEMQASKLPTSFDERNGKKRKLNNRNVSMGMDRTSLSNITPRMKQVQSVKAEKDMMQLKQTRKGLQGLRVSKTENLLVFNSHQKKNRKEGSYKSASKGTSKFRKEKMSSKKGKKARTRTGFRLEVRPGRSGVDGLDESSCNGKQTIFSWMIDRGAVREKEKIFCVSCGSKQTLKEGVVTREGILCRCCKKVYTSSEFETHAGKPYCDLVFTSGSSVLNYQLEAWAAELEASETQNYVGVSVADPNDDTCILCGDGGDLICCDRCPSTFHMSCLRISSIPEGTWYCPKCRCGTCGGTNHSKEEELTMVQCRQCEHRYHVSCLEGGPIMAGKLSFCSLACTKIFSTLRQLVGVAHPLGGGLSWSLLRCMDEDREAKPTDIKLRVEQHCKLAVALVVIKECFNPMIDPRTNIDMITQTLYNRWLEFDRLNYAGFYTAILERDGEIISVATIRIHGARLAEMPLIGTREKYRRQGMCRLLVGAIEDLLCSLEVHNFILPAIPELFDTWTQAFGFRPLDASQRLEIRDLSMMIFPGTELLQKSLMGICKSDRIVGSDSISSENGERKEISDSAWRQNNGQKEESNSVLKGTDEQMKDSNSAPTLKKESDSGVTQTDDQKETDSALTQTDGQKNENVSALTQNVEQNKESDSTITQNDDGKI